MLVEDLIKKLEQYKGFKVEVYSEEYLEEIENGTDFLFDDGDFKYSLGVFTIDLKNKRIIIKE